MNQLSYLYIDLPRVSTFGCAHKEVQSLQPPSSSLLVSSSQLRYKHPNIDLMLSYMFEV